ncbi:MAG: glycosyltransferase [Candidatus Latescibacteria bacterium]|nr:glycosyltransferase [bacterium]MBD3423643.1 glycosyltransferase [Candidatus Latescibacterota bacterium]
MSFEAGERLLKVLMAQKYHYRRGGDSVYMFNLSGLLREKGHQVAHFSMNHPQNIESEYEGYFTSELDFPALLDRRSLSAGWKVLTRSIYNREARDRMLSLIDDFKPDIAHFHNIHDHLTTSILDPLSQRGVPVVWTLHDYRPVCPNSNFLSGNQICERCLPGKFYNIFLHRCKKQSVAASLVAMLASYSDRMRGVYGRVRRFIAPSGFMKSKLSEGGIESERISVLPNFMDTGDYGVSDREGDYIIYFGRLSFEKGVDTLLRAFRGVESVRLVVAGEGPERKNLQELAAELNLASVEFAGFIKQPELRELVAESRFVILPSRWYENLPFSVMESMALGKAVVASEIGGIPEMVEDGVNGLLFPPEDQGRLREALQKLLAEPGTRKDMGRLGRKKAERLYSSEVHYQGIIDIYRELTQDR